VESGEGASRVGPRGVYEEWGCQPDRQDTCFVLEHLTAPTAAPALAQYLQLCGRPIAVLLLVADAHSLATAQTRNSPEDKAGYSPTYPDALAAAHDWLQTQLPALEAAARAAHVPVCRVHCEGPTEAQMTSLLIAATSS